jgi:hypothetical protein
MYDMMNIEYVVFLGFSFQGKNIYVMCVFSIVSFCSYIENLFSVNHCTRLKSTNITKLYKFDNFGSPSFPSVFVAHIDDLRKIWHEWFGHLSYPSLQKICNQEIVIGLPLVSFIDFVSVSCVLDKYHRDSFDKCASWLGMILRMDFFFKCRDFGESY